MRASYDTYINHGNSSSATIFSVMDRLRQKDMDELVPAEKVKDFVVGCAFGPGIAVEMCMLKRNLRHVRRTLVVTGGEATPPMTEADPSDESEGSRSEGEVDNQHEEGREAGTIPVINRELVSDTSNGEELDSLAEALNGVELD